MIRNQRKHPYFSLPSAYHMARATQAAAEGSLPRGESVASMAVSSLVSAKVHDAQSDFDKDHFLRATNVRVRPPSDPSFLSSSISKLSGRGLTILLMDTRIAGLSFNFLQYA